MIWYNRPGNSGWWMISDHSSPRPLPNHFPRRLESLEPCHDVTSLCCVDVKRCRDVVICPVVYPLVMTVCYRKSPFFMGKSTISMIMFNSYVNLPECIQQQMITRYNLNAMAAFLQVTEMSCELLWMQSEFEVIIAWMKGCFWVSECFGWSVDMANRRPT